MIRAYDKMYINSARSIMGNMLDYAVYQLKITLSDFFDLFMKSKYCKMFEQGDISVVCGCSGIELASLVLGNLNDKMEPKITIEKSEEYWAGWAIAYYQWYTSLSFKEITDVIGIDELILLYEPYHTMDITQLIDYLNMLYEKKRPFCNLKRIRISRNLSQKELAIYSDIPIRTIQQYEQRKKDINKASVSYVCRLAKALNCNIEDLIEKI